MYKLMKTVTEITESLREEGYIHDFNIKNDSICCEDCEDKDASYKPEELIIEKTERYEGDSNPSDNAIVYAITAMDGKRGVLVDSYGAYSDPTLAKIIGAIPLREQHNLQA